MPASCYNEDMAQAFRYAIIVGASSGIGAEMARRLTAQGCRVALVARREKELRSLATDLNRADTEPRAFPFEHDVRCYGEVESLFQHICRELGGLDLLVYAAGVMPRVAEDEYTFDKDRAMIEVNVLGAIAWINEAAQRFQAAGRGTVVGISSVAGDRGRRGQPVYCTSKAALDTYLEAVRNRVGRSGVRVVTIKPGPVDTPMTKGLDKLPLLIPVEEAARQILAAAGRGKRVAYVPAKWRPIMAVIRSIPSPLFQKLNV
jgi:decaprenylphospho-beta-D-erythro-pentofuranosid-2-ulose 2-reductase